MNKILVLYKSKYGATRKYADMLKEEIPCDVFDIAECKNVPFAQYDCVIFAGAVYASGISGLNSFRRRYEDIKQKKLAVFCVGASPFDEKSFEDIKKRNLKEDLKMIPVFYGRGAWNESKMNLKDRILCTLLHKMAAKQDPDACEPWMKALLSSVGQECDWTDRKYLKPLLDYVNNAPILF